MNGISTAVDYLAADVTALERRWAALSDDEWQVTGAAAAVRLFGQAAARVPAYARFLRDQGVDAGGVHTPEDLALVPPTTKSTYFDAYPLRDRMWDGDAGTAALVHASSGTTGEPRYWPCGTEELARSAVLYELVFTRSYGCGTGRSLLLVCFGMGTWVAGSYTAAAATLLRHKGVRVTTVTPGFNKAESLALLTRLAHEFDRVVIAGIPSFVKDLLDVWCGASGPPKMPVKLFLAGEGFPETWRSHVCDRIGGRPEAAVSIFGSADAGLMGFETPRSIALRRVAAADERVRSRLFSQDRVPALLNFVPTHRYFESVEGRLLLTADRAAPLIRYDTSDYGGVLPSGAIEEVLGSRSSGLAADGWECHSLPLVYVFGRGRMSATLYGANIPGEYIQEFLVHPQVAPLVSGRFVLETTYTETFAQQLRVRVELVDGAAAETAPAAWAELLADTLRRRSAEYARIWQEYGEAVAPVFTLHRYGNPEHFPTTQVRKFS
jgi:phenylacetate-coenzyme A ligase PaaK-like adenylate-forming protein